RAAIRRVGFSLLDMKRYLATRKLTADGFKVSLDDIAKAGVPGIALITVGGYRHFVVIKGVQQDRVLLGDPALGLRTVRRSEFLKMWNGIYFIINDRMGLARSQWNGPRQWAAYVGAPLGGGFLQPLSLQALYLTAPTFGDL
ncbi:MAG: C39 family peptidase, partial [Janthinobacterium lividum]